MCDGMFYFIGIILAERESMRKELCCTAPVVIQGPQLFTPEVKLPIHARQSESLSSLGMPEVEIFLF